jgi:hypothetical protein
MGVRTKRCRSAFANPPEELKTLLRRTGDVDERVAIAAQVELAKSFEQPLRKGLLYGDVLGDIFEPLVLEFGASPEYPLDIVAPGVVKEHRAYTIPAHGRIPERCVEGDYIMIPTYDVGSSIDWPLKLARNSRWDIVGRCMELYEAGYVKKKNDDGFHTLLAAAADRNIVVYDGNAGVGRLTLRLITLMQQAMQRNAGGNITSLSRGRMTDLYLSIEALYDMRNWTVADIDEATRRQIITSDDGYVSSLFNVDLHEMIELGVGQEYQNYFLSSSGLNGSLAPNDVELVLGLDLQRTDSFVNPIREEVQTFPDPMLHRQRRAGYYGWGEWGFGVADNRRVLLGSL